MRRYLPMISLLACAAALAFGIVRLFELRFDVGDVYPEYSTLRSDPLGAMAFYESLGRLPGLTVQRDFSTSNRPPGGSGTTYFHIASSVDIWNHLPEATFNELEQFVASGGRLVITILPQTSNAPGLPELERPPKVVTLRERWGVDFRTIALDILADSVYAPAIVENQTDLSLPETLDWHSAVVLTNPDPDVVWTPIYTRGTDPVVIERGFGRGTVVIATDSYFLSNEAMRADRHPALLSWLIGSGRTVIFDEAHLGVTERPGVATLVRKYRLQWFVAGVILLAGLFVWKNSSSLAPRRKEQTAQTYVAGKDAAAGFDNLLRRSIPKRELLATCFAVWKKSIGHTGTYAGTRIEQAEAVFETENSRPEKERDPVRAYQTISKILRAHIK